MARATWNGVEIARSAEFKIVEGNVYFPPEAIRREYFRPSEHHTTCPWKGLASYFDVVVDGKTNAQAAWFYPDPKPAAKEIKDHVAFWRGVQVEQ